MTEYRGHAYTIDRQRGGPRSLAIPGLCMRTIRVPSLGIEEEAWITLAKARDYVRRLIDSHIAEHGDVSPTGVGTARVTQRRCVSWREYRPRAWGRLALAITGGGLSRSGRGVEERPSSRGSYPRDRGFESRPRYQALSLTADLTPPLGGIRAHTDSSGNR